MLPLIDYFFFLDAVTIFQNLIVFAQLIFVKRKKFTLTQHEIKKIIVNLKFCALKILKNLLIKFVLKSYCWSVSYDQKCI